MNSQSSLDLLIGAVLKFDPENGERENVFAFIHSCYGGRVRTYDLDAALGALAKMTEEEQHALITWSLLSGARNVVSGARAAS